eukprot:IDg5668t1
MAEKKSCAGLLRNCLANSDLETLVEDFKEIVERNQEVIKSLSAKTIGELLRLYNGSINALGYHSVLTTGVEAVKVMHYIAVGNLPARRVVKAPSEVSGPDKSTKDAEESESEAEVEASSASEADGAQLKDESGKLKANLARLQALESNQAPASKKQSSLLLERTRHLPSNNKGPKRRVAH